MPRLAGRRKYSIVNLIKALAAWQHRRVATAATVLALQKQTLEWHRKDDLYEHVRGKVSHKALAIISQEANYARSSLKYAPSYALAAAAHRRCTSDLPRPVLDEDYDLSEFPEDACGVCTSHGLPCCHRLVLRFAQGPTQLSLEEIHPFYRLPKSFSSLSFLQAPEARLFRSQLAADLIEVLDNWLSGAGGEVPPDHQERLKAAVAAYFGAQSPSTSVGSVGSNAELLTPRKSIPRKAKGHEKLVRIPTASESSRKLMRTFATVHSKRCGRCRGKGHNRIQCDVKDEKLAEALAKNREEEKQEKAAEKQRLKQIEAEDKAKRQEAAREAAREAGQDVDSDDSMENVIADAGEQEDAGIDWTAGEPELLTHPSAQEVPTTGSPYALRRGPVPVLSASGSPAASSPGAKLPGSPIIPVDDAGLDSTLVSKESSAAAVAAYDDGALFSPTLPMLPLHCKGPPQPCNDAPLDFDSQQMQALRDIIGSNGENLRQVDAAVGEGAKDLASAAAQEAQNPTTNQPAQLESSVLAEVSYSRGRKQPSLMPTDNGDIFATTHFKQQLPSEGKGNCAFEAIMKQLGLEKPSEVRTMIWIGMQDPECRQALPSFTDKEWDKLLRRLFPGGVLPDDGGASMDNGCSSDYWYSDYFDPILAYLAATPVMRGSRDGSAAWKTTLPFKIKDLSQKPKPAIGLLYSPNHYDGFIWRDNKPLPPVSLVCWGQTKALEYVEAPTHQWLHDNYDFYTWGGITHARCGCFWTKETARYWVDMTREDGSVVFSREEQEAKTQDVELPKVKLEMDTPRRKSARQAEAAKEKEESLKEEQKRVEKAERDARAKQEALDADQREMRVTREPTEGIKLSSAQGAQMFPGGPGSAAARDEVRRLLGK